MRRRFLWFKIHRIRFVHFRFWLRKSGLKPIHPVAGICHSIHVRLSGWRQSHIPHILVGFQLCRLLDAILVQIHNALNAEHQEHIVLDIGVAVEEPALRAHAHRIEAKADITQGLLGVEGLPFRIIAMVFLNTQLIQVGQNGVILRM